jgi:uncharacterized surface protein with fasciclin (FAS1) repeats
MRIQYVATVAALALGPSAAAFAGTGPMVGGAAMYPSRNIIQNAVNSKDHTTLVAAVKAAGPHLPQGGHSGASHSGKPGT